MSESKHTPGPWEMSEGRERPLFLVFARIKGGTRQRVAQVDDWITGDPDNKEARSNAELIAAAPLMFNAGEKLAAWAARAVERWESGDLAEAVRNLDYARREWIEAVKDTKGE